MVGLVSSMWDNELVVEPAVVVALRVPEAAQAVARHGPVEELALVCRALELCQEASVARAYRESPSNVRLFLRSCRAWRPISRSFAS